VQETLDSNMNMSDYATKFFNTDGIDSVEFMNKDAYLRKALSGVKDTPEPEEPIQDIKIEGIDDANTNYLDQLAPMRERAKLLERRGQDLDQDEDLSGEQGTELKEFGREETPATEEEPQRLGQDTLEQPENPQEPPEEPDIPEEPKPPAEQPKPEEQEGVKQEEQQGSEEAEEDTEKESEIDKTQAEDFEADPVGTSEIEGGAEGFGEGFVEGESSALPVELEEEAIGGGVEDPFADIAVAVTALGAGIVGGILGNEAKPPVQKPKPPGPSKAVNLINPSVQFGY
jgi:hypothetical protein